MGTTLGAVDDWTTLGSRVCLNYVADMWSHMSALHVGADVQYVGHNVIGIVLATWTTSALTGAEVLFIWDFHTLRTATLLCVR